MNTGIFGYKLLDDNNRSQFHSELSTRMSSQRNAKVTLGANRRGSALPHRLNAILTSETVDYSFLFAAVYIRRSVSPDAAHTVTSTDQEPEE